MDRRVAGLLLLVVALVAVLVAPNIAGKQVRGAAVAEVIASPPAVGDCVTAIVSSTGATGGRRSTAPQTGSDTGPLPVATAAPTCTGKVLGEIISVTAAATTTVTTLDEYDQANPGCRSQVESYLGTTADSEIQGVQWSKSIYVDAVTVGPTAHDRAAGRTWTACVLAAVDQTYPASTALKSSWLTRTVPDALGLCWAQGVVQRGVPTACTSPHRTQQLGYGLVPGPSDTGTSIASAPGPDAVTAGCRQLAASVMGVADPTRGGALTIHVVADRSGAPYVQCAATINGAARLTGSLIGIGTRALPLV